LAGNSFRRQALWKKKWGSALRVSLAAQEKLDNRNFPNPIAEVSVLVVSKASFLKKFGAQLPKYCAVSAEKLGRRAQIQHLVNDIVAHASERRIHS